MTDLTPATIQVMFDQPPTPADERAAQVRAEIATLDAADLRPMLVLQRLEIERLRALITASDDDLLGELERLRAEVTGGAPVKRPVRRRRRASTATIANAMRILAADIQSSDGVANGACLEAAERLDELAQHEREDVKKMRRALRVISTWAACDALSPAADVYRMCREALGKRG